MNKIPYPKNYFEPYEDFEDGQEPSMEDAAEEMAAQIINDANKKIKQYSKYIYLDYDYMFMYNKLLRQLQIDLSDIIYENLELKEKLGEK